jgi:hypothetical protein
MLTNVADYHRTRLGEHAELYRAAASAPVRDARAYLGMVARPPSAEAFKNFARKFSGKSH